MNQDIGSIMSFLHNVRPCNVYWEKIEEGFEMPAIYLPRPYEMDSPDTISTYMVSYLMSVKIFNEDHNEAYEHASLLAQAIRRHRFLIPLVNEDGTASNGYLRINKTEIKLADHGVYTLMLYWNTRYKYTFEHHPRASKMGKIKFNVGTR